MNPDYQVAAYYFPNWHADADYNSFHGQGWTEWEILKCARPRFEGHQQPKVPLWGYQDESDPKVMAQKIDAAADHSVSAFLFDWYWKEDHPVMGKALDEGFLRAENNGRLKFALMWANHKKLLMRPNRRFDFDGAGVECPVDRPTFDRATDYIVAKYFSHPSYWRIDGKLYFQIYELKTLLDALGGVEATKDALEDFRTKTRAAGLGEIRLDCVCFGVDMLGDKGREILTELGIDGTAPYVWLHHLHGNGHPDVDYSIFCERAPEMNADLNKKYGLPFIPNVTMGWDPSPRTVQSEIYEVGTYPYSEILTGNTPEKFEKALRDCKDFLDQRQNNPEAIPQPKVLTVNAWNEWTEGSYLEPDTVNGYGYLDAIRRVFG